MCVWSALVLMLTKIHHPKSKTFCLASFLAKKDLLLAKDEPWQQKELNFPLGPVEQLLKSGRQGGGEPHQVLATGAEQPMDPFQGQNYVNKEIV